MARASDSPVQPVSWHVVVPVKESVRAKSRLAAPYPLSTPALARAVAADTLEQVCRALPPSQVVVVTSDTHARQVAEGLGATVVPDPAEGLNAAVRAGLEKVQAAMGSLRGELGGLRGELGGLRAGPENVQGGPEGLRGTAELRPGWAVLLGDLPALRAEDLVAALERCAAYPSCVVPDAAGTGTVLLTSTAGPPVPRFGSGSAARHAAGATLLELDLPRLRRDVDTAGDLADAVSLGVGPRTRQALGLGPA